MEKKLNIWNDYQNQKNYDLSFKTVDDNAPDHIILKETKDDRGKNGEQWNFKIVSKDYIDSKNAEQDETARQQQAQITEHSHTIREHDQKLVEIKEKDIEQDGKLTELENKNTEQDTKLEEHKNRLDELDGGHNSNLGKIGEIETNLENHKERIKSLETETNTFSPRVLRQTLDKLDLENKDSIVKCVLDIKYSDETGLNYNNITIHLSGNLIVDHRNYHNNILQLNSDNVFDTRIYSVSIANDEQPIVSIVHSKNINISSVSITEYSQIFKQDYQNKNDMVKWYNFSYDDENNNLKQLIFGKTEIEELYDDYCIVKGEIDYYCYLKNLDTPLYTVNLFNNFDIIYPKEAIKRYFKDRMNNFPHLMIVTDNGDIFFRDYDNGDYGNISRNGGFSFSIDNSKKEHHFKIFITAQLGRTPVDL